MALGDPIPCGTAAGRLLQRHHHRRATCGRSATPAARGCYPYSVTVIPACSSRRRIPRLAKSRAAATTSSQATASTGPSSVERASRSRPSAMLGADGQRAQSRRGSEGQEPEPSLSSVPRSFGWPPAVSLPGCLCSFRAFRASRSASTV